MVDFQMVKIRCKECSCVWDYKGRLNHSNCPSCNHRNWLVKAGADQCVMMGCDKCDHVAWYGGKLNYAPCCDCVCVPNRLVVRDSAKIAACGTRVRREIKQCEICTYVWENKATPGHSCCVQRSVHKAQACV